MFMKIAARQQAELFEKQSALINAMGDRFKGLIERMPRIPGMSYGEPPYIVDDGEQALLLVDANGSCSRLPSSFRLSEESVKEGYDALYSLPILSTGQSIRLIPARTDFDFSALEIESRAAQEVDPVYWKFMDELFQSYIDSTMALARENIASKLAGSVGGLAQICAENDIPIEDALHLPGLANQWLALFGEALADAATEVFQQLQRDEAEAGETPDRA